MFSGGNSPQNQAFSRGSGPLAALRKNRVGNLPHFFATPPGYSSASKTAAAASTASAASASASAAAAHASYIARLATPQLVPADKGDTGFASATITAVESADRRNCSDSFRNVFAVFRVAFLPPPLKRFRPSAAASNASAASESASASKARVAAASAVNNTAFSFASAIKSSPSICPYPPASVIRQCACAVAFHASAVASIASAVASNASAVAFHARA